MIFIGGIQPKTRIIDQTPRPCPFCGRNQAYYRRVDHYVSVFFLPVLKIKTGEPFLSCDTCQQEMGELVPAEDIPGDPGGGGCAACGRALKSDFRYCPHCGRPVNQK